VPFDNRYVAARHREGRSLVGPGVLRKSLRVVSFVKIERRKVLRRGSGWLEVVREAKLICRARVDGSEPRGGVTPGPDPRPSEGNEQ